VGWPADCGVHFAAESMAVGHDSPSYNAAESRVRRLQTRGSITTIGASMAQYIDGFALPISRDRLGEYKRLAETVAKIWREHGALDYREYVGDDLYLEGTRSFTDVVAAAEDETVVFGWVVFDSRESRDRANKKVAADPRMADLIHSSNSGFDAGRMAYGGFQTLVASPNANTE